MLLLLASGCSGSEDDADADAGVDAGTQVGTDAGTPPRADAGTDAGTGGGTDGGGGGGTSSVGGRVTYDFVPATYSPALETGTLDFSQATVRPVRNAVVRVRQGTAVLATTNTDEQGRYQVSFPTVSGGGLSVLVLARTVSPSIQVEDNTDGDAVWAMGSAFSSTAPTVNLHASHGWTGSSYNATRRVSAPFAVLDSMYTAARAFMAVRTVTFPALKVNWSPDNVPERGDKDSGFIGTSHFAPADNEIYILGKEGVDTDEFDSHVIVHEWAHYFEGNLSRSDSPGGPHSTGDVLDPRLAFGEGYGNALAAMILPETVYADTHWGGADGTLASFGFDAETAPSPSDDPSPGAFSETSVLRLLYDVYDAPSAGEAAYDQVSVGLGPLYDVLVGPQKTTGAMTTIGSFIAGLKRQPGVSAAAVDTLLAHYELGPITTEWGDGDGPLREMYTRLSALPYQGDAVLAGGHLPNKRYQNQYYAFTGTGGAVDISATSDEDVGITVYQQGRELAVADDHYSGQEALSLTSTQSGATYIVVLTGFSEASEEYVASVSITSP